MLLVWLLVLLGLIMGSFFSVVIYRVPRKQSIVAPRSSCPKCGHVLGPLDMVPVLSYVVTQGKCRHCGVRISGRYPLLELMTAAGFTVGICVTGNQENLVVWLVFFSLLLILALIDLDHMLLPDKITFFGMILGLTLSAAGWNAISLVGSVAGLIAGYVTLFLVEKVSRGGMGRGDAKLLAMIGSFLGPSGAMVTLAFGSIVGSIIGVGLILLGRHQRKTPMPFGPFLAIGALLAWVFPFV